MAGPNIWTKNYNLNLYYNRKIGVSLSLTPMTFDFVPAGYNGSKNQLAWNPSGFTYYNLDTDTVISQLLDLGITHLQMGCKNYSGYASGFPSLVSMDYGNNFTDSYRTFNSPQYNNYGFDFGENVNGFKTILSAMMSNNIDVDFYYNIGLDINTRGGGSSNDPGDMSWLATNWRALDTAYVDYTIARIREMLDYFGVTQLKRSNPNRCFCVWCDAPVYFPRSYIATLYNAIKSSHPFVLLTFNYRTESGTNQPGGTSTLWPGTIADDEFYMWPIDILTYERARYLEMTDETAFDHNKTQIGVPVRVGHELMTSVLSTTSENIADLYGWNDTNYRKTQTQMNAIYNDFVVDKKGSVTFALCAHNLVGDFNGNGTYVTEHLNLVKNIPR